MLPSLVSVYKLLTNKRHKLFKGGSMSMVETQKKPSGVWLFLSFLVAAVSIYGIMQVFTHGQEESYGISREVPWGILIIGYSFLVGISAGAAVIGSLAHVFKVSVFHVESKRVALISLAALVGAFFLIFWELAGPFELQSLRLLKYYSQLEFTSPIWWMATLYVLELPLLALEIYFLLSKKKNASFFAALVGFFMGIIAYSTLAFVFASNATRPLWNTTSFSLTFLISATAAGAAVVLLVLFMSGKGKILKKETDALSKTLFLGLCVIFFINAWNILMYTYSNVDTELGATMKLFIGSGVLSSNFYYMELLVGIFLPLVFLLIGKFHSSFLSALAGLFMLIGMFFHRYDNIIEGQLLSRPSTQMDFVQHSYHVSNTELSLFIGGLGVAGIVYFLGEMLFNLEEEEAHA
jgi:molybdopterin-containing oxidoreductase family membrane subunit